MMMMIMMMVLNVFCAFLSGILREDAEKIIDTMIPYREFFLNHIMVMELGASSLVVVVVVVVVVVRVVPQHDGFLLMKQTLFFSFCGFRYDAHGR